jgi:hypothetical protein
MSSKSSAPSPVTGITLKSKKRPRGGQFGAAGVRNPSEIRSKVLEASKEKRRVSAAKSNKKRTKKRRKKNLKIKEEEEEDRRKYEEWLRLRKKEEVPKRKKKKLMKCTNKTRFDGVSKVGKKLATRVRV